MKHVYLAITLLPAALSGCVWTNDRGTIAELRNVTVELEDETVVDGLDKAMASYRRYLEETPKTAMTPEAMRRIADLSIEKEYGYIADGNSVAQNPRKRAGEGGLAKPDAPAGRPSAIEADQVDDAAKLDVETEAQFEERVSRPRVPAARPPAGTAPEFGDDLANPRAEEAVALYRKLLREYPLYQRNDQVMYQMSRAYEELGKIDEAMAVMNRFVELYPGSKYMGEIQFRIAEYHFSRKRYLNAEDAYRSVVDIGPGSTYFELALYKLGWAFYKQELYEEALNKYFGLLDYKVEIGYDFDQEYDQTESKRIEDTYRVISLSFSNLGGPDTVVDYFARHGNRGYEDQVYSHLGEFYLVKRRYSDAAAAYQAFVGLYPHHEVSPRFSMRVIDIYTKGGFGKLVIQAKKDYANTYALESDYWNYFDVEARPDVVDFLKQNLKDLANHYHALYQDERFVRDKADNYADALLWYRNYLASFPEEMESPALNYQMADLMLENKDYGGAAIAYENTAYNYPPHDKSAAAGYAAVYAHRENLEVVPEPEQEAVQQQVIASSLKFANTYPEHEKVDIVLGAAADDLFEAKNYELAVKTARKLIDNYPDAESELRRSGWLVVGHGSFELGKFDEAEKGYVAALDLTAQNDESKPELLNNLAAAIYRQGEQANELGDYAAAAEHFLRIGKLAPASEIRPAAEYDAAAALIELQDWERAAGVLVAFRNEYPDHELQPEVTKKIAFVYKSAGKLGLAAQEYERIEREARDEDVRRGALSIAADLYGRIGARPDQLVVYNRYVESFPRPVEQALEVYDKMSGVYLALDDEKNYRATLRQIVEIDKGAGNERTDRTRYLAAQASLVLTRPLYDRFVAVKLVEPLKENLDRKKQYMKAAIDGYTKLIEYEVADVTAAATYYMAEIYYHFSQSLLDSERPDDLSPLELEEFELALEDQAYPFEEKAIAVHRKNVELLHAGVYSDWIDKSIGKLALIYPAAYARTEEHTGFIHTIDSFSYAVEQASVDGPPEAEQDDEQQGDDDKERGGRELTAITGVPVAPGRLLE